jgi:hypothetical protein
VLLACLDLPHASLAPTETQQLILKTQHANLAQLASIVMTLQWMQQQPTNQSNVLQATSAQRRPQITLRTSVHHQSTVRLSHRQPSIAQLESIATPMAYRLGKIATAVSSAKRMPKYPIPMTLASLAINAPKVNTVNLELQPRSFAQKEPTMTRKEQIVSLIVLSAHRPRPASQRDWRLRAQTAP